MEVMGYPIYSGSNTICTATAVLEAGLVAKQEGTQRFALESPAGLVQIEALVRDGVVESITCEGLPQLHSHAQGQHQRTRDRPVNYSVAYSGGFYALVDAAELGFSLTREEERALNDCAFAIVEALQAERGFPSHTGRCWPVTLPAFHGPGGPDSRELLPFPLHHLRASRRHLP